VARRRPGGRRDPRARLRRLPIRRVERKDHRATPAQALIAGALQRDTSVIPKSVRPARLAENLAAELALDARDVAALDRKRRYVRGRSGRRPGAAPRWSTCGTSEVEAVRASVRRSDVARYDPPLHS
jgi:alcohol dehydrogenase (NADP+)